jgi:uncharacterized membrane protein YphA (DoxX/SURF4 family)
MYRSDYGRLSLRIGLGLFFLIFGIMKFAATGPLVQGVYPQFYGSIAGEALVYIIGVLQIAGGVLLLIGWQTRIAATVVGVMHLASTIVSIGRIVTPFTFPEQGPPHFLFFSAVPILFAIIALILVGPGRIRLGGDNVSEKE